MEKFHLLFRHPCRAKLLLDRDPPAVSLGPAEAPRIEKIERRECADRGECKSDIALLPVPFPQSRREPGDVENIAAHPAKDPWRSVARPDEAQSAYNLAQAAGPDQALAAPHAQKTRDPPRRHKIEHAKPDAQRAKHLTQSLSFISSSCLRNSPHAGHESTSSTMSTPANGARGLRVPCMA